MSGLHHEGAFVVQFETGADFAIGLVKGRIEHVASGRKAGFQSSDELQQALARMLKDVTLNRPEAGDRWKSDSSSVKEKTT